MIEEGKDKIEWYRQVDPAKLNTLKELVASPNYKVHLFGQSMTLHAFRRSSGTWLGQSTTLCTCQENFGVLIQTIYYFTYFSGKPWGPDSDNLWLCICIQENLKVLIWIIYNFAYFSLLSWFGKSMTLRTFQENLGVLNQTIYDFAYFSGKPLGPDSDNLLLCLFFRKTLGSWFKQ